MCREAHAIRTRRGMSGLLPRRSTGVSRLRSLLSATMGRRGLDAECPGRVCGRGARGGSPVMIVSSYRLAAMPSSLPAARALLDTVHLTLSQ